MLIVGIWKSFVRGPIFASMTKDKVVATRRLGEIWTLGAVLYQLQPILDDKAMQEPSQYREDCPRRRHNTFDAAFPCDL